MEEERKLFGGWKTTAATAAGDNHWGAIRVFSFEDFSEVAGVCVADIEASNCLVPRAGVEPARPYGQRILSSE